MCVRSIDLLLVLDLPAKIKKTRKKLDSFGCYWKHGLIKKKLIRVFSAKHRKSSHCMLFRYACDDDY